MGQDEYKITFINPNILGAREKELIIGKDYLIQQLNILQNSGYKILKVKVIEH